MNSMRKPTSGWCVETLAWHISEIVAKESGNILGKGQQSMVVSRLKKRLIELGNITAQEYYIYLMRNYATEEPHLVSMLTTHHTFFFREFIHFEFLLKNLKTIVENVKQRGGKKIRIFSAACSRGQEAYSLAMFFEYHLKQHFPAISYEVLGMDIDEQCIQIAANGVYPYQDVKSIPQQYLEGNWQRGTGEIERFVKVKPHIKKNCSFRSGNLLTFEKLLENNKFDIIFCRNVFIYFDQTTIYRIVDNLRHYIFPGGILVTGLSESLSSLDIPKKTLASSVYCFSKNELIKENEITNVPQKVNSTFEKQISKPIKVLVVDDSQTVLNILSKIFEKDPEFKLAGVAKNGIEAQQFLLNNKVDVMTLDIHMPEMDGVEYLKRNYGQNHPPVLVVSSASREDTRYAQETLKYGARDFVEKPELNHLEERAEEIKNKIKMLVYTPSVPLTFSLDKSFKITYDLFDLDNKARIFFLNFSDKQKLISTLRELKGSQPPCFIFFEGNANYLDLIADELKSFSQVQVYNAQKHADENVIYLCDFKKHFDSIKQIVDQRKISISIFGICSRAVVKKIVTLSNTQVLVEDVPGVTQDFKKIASDIFPWTSFSHLGTEFLAKGS